MGTPEINALQMLVRRTPLDMEEWHHLLEVGRVILNPHLCHFTLKTIGEVQCLKDADQLHAIDPCTSMTGDGHSLNTQGIFAWGQKGDEYHGSWADFYQGTHGPPHGIKYVWGLTRNARWIILQIHFYGEPGHKNRGYERAKRLDLRLSHARNIAEVTRTHPMRMLEVLGETVKNWLWARQNLLAEAEHLAQQLGRITSLLQWIPLHTNPPQ